MRDASSSSRARATASARPSASRSPARARPSPSSAARSASSSRTYDRIVADGGPKPALLPFNLETAAAPEYDALFEALDREFGRLDGLAHVAGILGDLSPIEQYDVPTWCKVLHVNLTAAFILTRTLLPLLRSVGRRVDRVHFEHRRPRSVAPTGAPMRRPSSAPRA